MKVKFGSLLVALLISSLFSTATEVYAIPPLPASVYGSVTSNGENVEADLLVEALSGDKVIASGLTRTLEGASIYSLIIPGDDPETNQIEGALDGEKIRFTVAGVTVEQTLLWHSGASEELNLEYSKKINDQKTDAEAAAENSQMLDQEDPVAELPGKVENRSNWYLWLLPLIMILVAIQLGVHKKIL